MTSVIYVNRYREVLPLKVSRERMQANRHRILTEAGRLFRDRGFNAVGVAEVMQAAGLTHGAFYGHFASKDDLIAQAVAHMLDAAVTDLPLDAGFGGVLDAYLTDRHRQNIGRGCPTAALATDIQRQSPKAREALSLGIERQIDRVAKSIVAAPNTATRKAAAGSWAAMVGALILARSIEDEEQASEFLANVRSWLKDRIPS